VVLSNFKPGTMESLGLGHEALAEINPRVVVAESSAFGATGPWSRKMGYGPLVRAATGLTGLWRYPDDEGSFSDASTIYPDHVAARIEATAVLAKLIQRRRTGRGGTVGVAQCDVILGQLADRFAQESARPGFLVAAGNEGVHPCAGDDEWCVIGIRDDADRARLAALLGDESAATWTAARPHRRALEELQAAGVPAAMMQRVPELLHDPHLVARGFFRTMTHPHIPVAMPTENAPAVFRAVADPPLEPAPLPGEHSRLVLRRVLGMSDHEIDRLVADGVVDEPAVNRSSV
jgi:crotonobetainyl-CoA:carnitine CoA-transferase CaiB-like acyl-CoA transferase